MPIQKRHIPNILSVLRLVLSLLMLWLFSHRVLFLALYLLCGLTDVLDGWLARRYGWGSALGARLDSVADFVFWAVVLGLLIVRVHVLQNTLFTVLFAAVVLLRGANLVVSLVRFHKAAPQHTLGNKLTGLLLFFYVLSWLFWGQVPVYATAIMGGFAMLAALEELAISATAQEYSANRKGLFFSE